MSLNSCVEVNSLYFNLYCIHLPVINCNQTELSSSGVHGFTDELVIVVVVVVVVVKAVVVIVVVTVVVVVVKVVL